MSAEPRRVAFLAAAMSRIGMPYVWCAKGPHQFDCSGLVTWALREVGGADLRAMHNTTKLWLELPPTEHPEPGDLAFYTSSPEHEVDHVMVVGPLGLVFGAAGGDHTTTSLVEALRRKARVRVEPRAEYRPGFRGYRSLAPYLTGVHPEVHHG